MTNPNVKNTAPRWPWLLLLTAGLTSSSFGQTPTPITPAASAEAPQATPAPGPTPESVRPPRVPRSTGAGKIGSTSGEAGTYAPGYGGGGGYGGGYALAAGDSYGNINVTRPGTRESIPPVVVQFSNADPVAIQQMEEDLAIMNHVLGQALEKGLGEETPPSRLGVPLLYTWSGRSVRSMYLEGFGPLFMVKINIPLLALSSREDKPAPKSSDSEWESARREVLGLDNREDVSIGSMNASDVPFDPNQVEALKQTLLIALKNTANMRQLKPDDYVTLAIFGQPMAQTTSSSVTAKTTVDLHTQDQQADDSGAPGKSTPSTTVRPSKSGRKSSSARSTAGLSAGNVLVSNSPQKGTVLTMRVKSSDIAAFAQDKVKLEEFTKKVALNTYAGSGYGVTSVNSWIQSGRPAISVGR